MHRQILNEVGCWTGAEVLLVLQVLPPVPHIVARRADLLLFGWVQGWFQSKTTDWRFAGNPERPAAQTRLDCRKVKRMDPLWAGHVATGSTEERPWMIFRSNRT